MVKGSVSNGMEQPVPEGTNVIGDIRMQQIVPSVSCVLEAGDYMGESPIWVAAERALYWVNVEREPRVARLDMVTGDFQHWPMPERIGGMALREDSDRSALIALASGIFDLDLTSGALKLRAASSLPAHFALHETKCDRQGRLWVGAFDTRFKLSDGPKSEGWFQRLDGDRLTPVIPGITVANGLAWSLDGRSMYHTDSATDKVWISDYDPATGEVGDRRVFTQLDRDDGVPDGAAVDAEDGYWLNFYRGGRIRRYMPDGRISCEIRLPFTQGTMLAFGGDQYRTAYLATTRHGFDEERLAREPLIGSLFSFPMPVSGLAEPRFRASYI